MEDLLGKQVVKELVFAAVASFLIFQLSLFFYLFTIPVFYMGRKYGWHTSLVLAAVLLAAVTVQLVVKMRGFEDSQLKGFIVIYGLSYPVMLLAGTAVVTVFSGRSLYKMLAATALFAAAGIPAILIFSGNDHVVSFLKEQIAYVTGIILGNESSLASMDLKSSDLMNMVKVIAFRDFIAAYFYLLAGCWYLSDLFFAKRQKTGGFSFENFDFPDWFVWILIVSLSGVLADHLFTLGWAGYISWNAALIMMLMYGIKGVGLISFLLKKYNVTKQKRRSLIMILFILFLIPGLNLVVLLGIPGFGISEIWVRYR